MAGWAETGIPSKISQHVGRFDSQRIIDTEQCILLSLRAVEGGIGFWITCCVILCWEGVGTVVWTMVQMTVVLWRRG
jgi:hypothetical protein